MSALVSSGESSPSNRNSISNDIVVYFAPNREAYGIIDYNTVQNFWVVLF